MPIFLSPRGLASRDFDSYILAIKSEYALHSLSIFSNTFFPYRPSDMACNVFLIFSVAFSSVSCPDICTISCSGVSSCAKYSP